MNANNLIAEMSPYLLQHAYNPVHWYPWGDEAFSKAETEDKPVFLSIGYSTCHWCHVMEEESFEDKEVAEILNRSFVAVKVDREERPDIDTVYMTVCQAMTGQGGWPLTILMTPEKKPFFAGTYFPKHSFRQMPGLVELLELVEAQWQNSRGELLEAGEKIAVFASQLEEQTSGVKINESVLKDALQQFKDAFDQKYGGFSPAPKFPTPHHLLFLLQYKSSCATAEKTLESMYRGGIFDHIGFGFSRYSTDRKWLVPHFEKMLYDNALLAYTYLSADSPFFHKVAEKVLRYLEREMRSPEGGFYSAQDADSEGEEGKYYVFTPEEIIRQLGAEKGVAFNLHFDITQNGNFEGKSIPNLLSNTAFQTEDREIEKAAEILYSYRRQRTKLHLDDKILTSWNGMALAAFSKAYRVLKAENDLKLAENCYSFIENHLSMEKKLFVRYRNTQTAGKGHLDDYVFYIWGLTELYQATGRPLYLAKAADYCSTVLEAFCDEKNGGFFLTENSAETLLFRPKETYDGAIPSGNSMAFYVFVRLYQLTGRKEYQEASERQLAFLSGKLTEYPMAHSFSLYALHRYFHPGKRLVCVLRTPEERQKLLPYFHKFENILVLGTEEDELLRRTVPPLEHYSLKDGKTTFYVCGENSCSPPFHNIENLENSFD